jgi:Fe-S-cluster-containing dehydrogenase component/CRP-like cAMP-binding protein
MTAAAWSEAVWSAAALRGVDARARAEIEAAGALVSLGDGEVLFRPGEPADAFFVVAEGRVRVRAVRRGETSATTLREVAQGESFGEEGALRAGGARQLEAVSVGQAKVAQVPLGVFRRAIERTSSGDVHLKRERALRRAATLDLLRATSFTRDLPERDLEVLLDAAEHVTLARGEALFREGEAPERVYFVADGMLQIQTEDDARVRVRAYVSRGDVVGDEEATTGARYAVSAVASGAAWVIAVPRAPFAAVARRHPGLLETIRRVAEEHAAAQQKAVSSLRTTRHVFKDLYRMQVARSLLVIDASSCVRCGHCAWSCAATHDDHVSRLVRRGDTIVTKGAASAPLLVPTSCQHCENPACMRDCPTGAIGRDPRGDVFIREDLCTGCGNCAKGCPWDNIQMASRRDQSKWADVAVKCDLCGTRSGGPACVAACPTQAIARVNPQEVMPELGAARAALLPRATPAWPWVSAAALVALAVPAFRATSRAGYVTSGAVAAALMALVAAYAIVKRLVLPRVRPWTIAHLALGTVTLGAVAAHAGARVPPNVAGALQLAFWGTTASGILAAIAYRFAPKVLARLERKGTLPEDLAGETKRLDERTFAELTGKSELAKTIYARVLQPYASSKTGPIALAVSGRTIGEEGRRVRARIDAILAGKDRKDKLAGIDALVRLAVERRALPAVRALGALLRAFVPLHVVATAVVIVLLAAHAFLALRYK